MSERVVRNVGVLLGANVLVIGLNFLSWVYLGRVLSPTSFGVLGFGFALLTYFTLSVDLGFDRVAVREAVRDPGRREDLLGHVLGLRLSLAAVAGAVWVGVVLALDRPWPFQLTLLILGLALVERAVRVEWAFQAMEQMGVFAVRDVLLAALTAAGVVVLVRAPAATVPAAAALAAGPLVASLWLWVTYRQRFGPIRARYDRQAWTALLRPALPLAAAAALIEIYLRIDQVMLEFLDSTESVGYYSATVKLLALALVVPRAVQPAVYPRFAAALGDLGRMRATVRRTVRAMLAFAFPVALAGPWLAGWLVTTVYGAAYAPGGAALRILFVSTGVACLNAVLSAALTAWDLQRVHLYVVGGGAATNILANLALIPPLGVRGAAFATLAAEAVVLVGFVVVYVRTTGEHPFSGVGAALIGGLVPAAVAAGGVALGWSGWACAALAVGSFAAVAGPLRLLDPAVTEAVRLRLARLK